MHQQSNYLPFRNVLFNVPAISTEIPLHELRQTPATNIVGSMHGVLLQSPHVVLTGPDLHQPELLNPDTLNAGLMCQHIDKKIGSLQSIQLNSDDLSAGLMHLCRTYPYEEVNDAVVMTQFIVYHGANLACSSLLIISCKSHTTLMTGEGLCV